MSRTNQYLVTQLKSTEYDDDDYHPDEPELKSKD